jgi:hypothetical protein
MLRRYMHRTDYSIILLSCQSASASITHEVQCLRIRILTLLSECFSLNPSIGHALQCCAWVILLSCQTAALQNLMQCSLRFAAAFCYAAGGCSGTVVESTCAVVLPLGCHALPTLYFCCSFFILCRWKKLEIGFTNRLIYQCDVFMQNSLEMETTRAMQCAPISRYPRYQGDTSSALSRRSHNTNAMRTTSAHQCSAQTTSTASEFSTSAS